MPEKRDVSAVVVYRPAPPRRYASIAAGGLALGGAARVAYAPQSGGA